MTGSIEAGQMALFFIPHVLCYRAINLIRIIVVIAKVNDGYILCSLLDFPNTIYIPRFRDHEPPSRDHLVRFLPRVFCHHRYYRSFQYSTAVRIF